MDAPLRPPSDADFQRWLRDGTLTSGQVEAIRGDLAAPACDESAPTSIPVPSREQRTKGLNVLDIAYYAGALLILGALGWFLGSQWDTFGPPGIFGISLAYAILFSYLGYLLRFRYGYPNAGGLLATCAVWMVPLMAYALEDWAGVWPGSRPGSYSGYFHWINGSWMVIELATAVVGVMVLRFIHFPFLVFPVALSVWFFSMDAAEMLSGHLIQSHDKDWISVGIGLIMLAASFLADRRFEMDLAFWGYFFGLSAFWGGLTDMDSGSELGKAIYAFINLVLLGLGIYLDRRAFLVFGSLGLLFYLYHLADAVFKNSPLFPFAVAFVGLAILLGAVYLQRHAQRISTSLDRFRPTRLRAR